MQPFDYYRPESFTQAYEYLNIPNKNVLVLAGGTDLIPNTRDAKWQPDAVVDIKNLPGLRTIEIAQIAPCCGIEPHECLYIGAAVRMNELIHSQIVGSHWSLLQQAASAMGNEQVRNRATIGGNICTASPAADSSPGLLVLDAKALIKGPAGDRCIAISDFFLGPKKNCLNKSEIVVGLLIPQPPVGSQGHYEKLSRRKAGDLAIVSVAVMTSPSNLGYRWKLALGAVSPTPIRAFASEKILNEAFDSPAIDKAAAQAYGCCSPIDDIRSGMAYRQEMVINMTRRAIHSVLHGIGKD